MVLPVTQHHGKPAFLENGQAKDAAIAAQRQHFHIQPKDSACKPCDFYQEMYCFFGE